MGDNPQFSRDETTTVREHRPNAASGGSPSGEDAFRRLKQQGSELFEYCAYYLETQKDQLWLRGRKFQNRMELEVLGLLVAAGAFLVAITLLFLGLAQGLAQAYPGKPWLGLVGAGVLLLVCTGVGVWLWMAGQQFISHKQTVKKYEQRKRQQQARFGHDVAERANESRSKE